MKLMKYLNKKALYEKEIFESIKLIEEITELTISSI